jgi:hypothetical protein
MTVDLDIDELILHGVPAAAGDSVGAAVRQELARLLAQAGVPPSLGRAGAASEIRARAIDVQPGTPPRLLGQQLAASIYQSLGTL